MGLKEKQAMAGLDFSWAEKRIRESAGADVNTELSPALFSSSGDFFSDSEVRDIV